MPSPSLLPLPAHRFCLLSCLCCPRRLRCRLLLLSSPFRRLYYIHPSQILLFHHPPSPRRLYCLGCLPPGPLKYGRDAALSTSRLPLPWPRSGHLTAASTWTVASLLTEVHHRGAAGSLTSTVVSTTGHHGTVSWVSALHRSASFFRNVEPLSETSPRASVWSSALSFYSEHRP